MIIHRGFRFKMKPTAEQESLFWQFAGACRFVYNLALEQREKYRDTYEYAGLRLNYVVQSRELSELRSELDWLAAVPRVCLEQGLRDLDKAFGEFFAGRKRYPTTRKRGVNDSFRFQGKDVALRSLNAKWAAIRLPKVGWVKFRSTRQIPTDLRTVTVSANAFGWFISFGCTLDIEDPVPISTSVGIDLGVATTLMLSSGETFCMPAGVEALDQRHRSAQRILARRKKGSRRRRKAMKRCARISAKRASVRRDWHHKVSCMIAARFGTVVMEDLKVVNMTASAKGTIDAPGANVRQKAGLNRSILNQGWSRFTTILDYKLEQRGGTLVLVNPTHTSQTCSNCGTVDKASRKSQAVFNCQHCGFRANADYNAAINILRRNTASMGVEEGHKLSGEALTGSGARPAENHSASVG